MLQVRKEDENLKNPLDGIFQVGLSKKNQGEFFQARSAFWQTLIVTGGLPVLP